MEDYKRSSWRIPGASTNSVYDDIFGGPPRFAGAPYVAATAASRVDEYALIFGGRDGSSIPVLDPPPVVEVADSRSSGFDYDEIFRGFDGGDFGVPYEDLFLEAEKSRDLPMRSDSEQEELKTLGVPSVRMNGDDVNFHDKNEDLFSTNRDSNHLPDSTKKSNMSNHKISQRSDEVNGVATHISELHDVPGYRFAVDASSGCQTESITVELSNGSLNGEVVKAEHLKKDELYSISSDCSIDHLKTFQDPRSPNSNALRWKLKVEKQFFEMEQEANSKKIQDFLLAEGNEKLKAVGHTIRQERSQKKVVVDKQETKKLRADREPCVLKEIKELKTANSEKNKRSVEETYELDETGKIVKTDCLAYDHKESDKNLAEEAYKYKESEMKLREAIEAHDHEDKENMGFLLKAEKKLKAEIKSRECEERGRNCVDIEKRLDKKDCVLEESKKKHKEAKRALEHEERERNIGEEVQKIEDNEKTLVEEAYIHEENEKKVLEREEREEETMNEAQGLKRNGMSRKTTTDRKNGNRQVDGKLRQAENGPEKNEYENNPTSAHVLHKEENRENGSEMIRRSHNIRVDVSHNLEENKKRTKASQEVRQRFQNGKESEAAQHDILPGGREDTPKPALRVPMNQLVQEEKKQRSQKMDKEERIQREMEERARKLEEEREREREREKDRIISVEIATREREQRDSAEKTTTEVRQRAMAEAREKAAAEARGKLLAEKAVAKLRAHRTAAERANAEAHEHAVEKAPAEEDAFDAREWAERSFSERSTAPYRDWQSTSFNDARDSSHDRKFHDRGSFNAFNSSEKFHGTKFDSPFICRAQLEMRQRTSEQRSLADTVDDDEIIRWSNGKGGSLCALLSTLQYILVPECGWQPIPLTEMITTQDVKRAYKRAALCVHPDKVQQRSAGIREKHICEKVFNLLKEAMDKFDAEQRRTGVC